MVRNILFVVLVLVFFLLGIVAIINKGDFETFFSTKKKIKPVASVTDVKEQYCDEKHFEKISLNRDIKSQEEFDKYIDNLLSDNELEKAALTTTFYSKNNLNNTIDISSRKKVIGNLLRERTKNTKEFYNEVKDYNKEEIFAKLNQETTTLEQLILISNLADIRFEEEKNFDDAYLLQNCLVENYRSPLAMLWMSQTYENGTESLKEKDSGFTINNEVKKDLNKSVFWYGASVMESRLSVFENTYISVESNNFLIISFLAKALVDSDLDLNKSEVDKIYDNIDNFTHEHYDVNMSLRDWDPFSFTVNENDELDLNVFYVYINFTEEEGAEIEQMQKAGEQINNLEEGESIELRSEDGTGTKGKEIDEINDVNQASSNYEDEIIIENEKDNEDENVVATEVDDVQNVKIDKNAKVEANVLAIMKDKDGNRLKDVRCELTKNSDDDSMMVVAYNIRSDSNGECKLPIYDLEKPYLLRVYWKVGYESHVSLGFIKAGENVVKEVVKP